MFKLILEKADHDKHIQRFDFHRFDNDAEVTRMEHATFIIDIRDSIRYKTARIEGLEANLDAINHSVNAIKAGLKRQMKIEATFGLVCAALNAISFGVGGSILEGSIHALGSIVDYSDLTHILKIAEQWGEGCADQVQTGIDLAMDEFAEKSLSEFRQPLFTSQSKLYFEEHYCTRAGGAFGRPCKTPLWLTAVSQCRRQLV